MAKKQSRIQIENRDRILASALDVFALHGFRGASIDEIAAGASMSKPNLFYYYKRKEDIHQALLNRLLQNWLQPLRDLDAEGDPQTEIINYIRRKIEMARDYPRESRLFANDIMRGGEHIKDILGSDLKELVDEKAALIKSWMADGKLTRADPHHLIFAIWAMTQHYADFDVQVRALLGPRKGGEGRFEDAARNIEQILLKGLLPR